MLSVSYASFLKKPFPTPSRAGKKPIPSRGKTLTTRAVKTEQIRSDYWSHNAPGDSTLRNELGVKGI